MPGPVSFVKTEVPYPVFEADFDPYNRGYLVVAGGGGENNNGVPNRITLLDTASKHRIDNVAEIDLSTQEDSVQSLANLGTRDGLISFAGINSSQKDLKSGKNDHFRTFSITYPTKRRPKSEDEKADLPKGKIELTSKTSIFGPVRDSKQQPYQRVCRLSPASRRESGIKRLGAIATAWLPENEVVIFDATAIPPTKSSICERIKVEGGAEAEDLDIAEHSDGWFVVVYCTEYEVYVDRLHYDFLGKKTERHFPEPPCVYTVPKGNKAGRPKLRSLRWISPNHVLMLQNYPQDRGAELLVLRVHPPTANPGVITLTKKLPFKQAVNRGLDVCLLDQDPTTFERQIVVAVAGTDRSIHIYTENYDTTNRDPLKQISKLSKFTSLSDVHPNNIGKLTLSNFFPPQQPSDSVTSAVTAQQHIQLASISVANTIVVDTIALTSIPVAPSQTPEAQSGGKRKTPAVRYVLATGSNNILRSWPGLMASGLIILIVSVLIQSFFTQQTPLPTQLSQFNSLLAKITDNPTAQGFTDKIYPNAAATPTVGSTKHGSLRSLLHEAAQRRKAKPASEDDPEIEYAASPILVRPHPDHPIPGLDPNNPSKPDPATIPQDQQRPDLDGNDPSDPIETDDVSDPLANVQLEQAPLPEKLLATEHEDAVDLRLQGIKAYRWEEMGERSKAYWREAMKKAGQWAEHEGEGILKGVFFAEVADVVGGAIRDAVVN